MSNWFDILYNTSSSDDLKNCSSFSFKPESFHGYIRVVCLFLLFSCYAVTTQAWPLSELFTMFSNWTLHLQTLSVFTSLQCELNKEIKNFKNQKIRALLAKQHFLYSICIMMNIVVVLVYWPIIHPETIGKHHRDGPYIKVIT